MGSRDQLLRAGPAARILGPGRPADFLCGDRPAAELGDPGTAGEISVPGGASASFGHGSLLDRSCGPPQANGALGSVVMTLRPPGREPVEDLVLLLLVADV